MILGCRCPNPPKTTCLKNYKVQKDGRSSCTLQKLFPDIARALLLGAALPRHSFQKLFHVPDLFVICGLTGIEKRRAVLIVQRPFE